MKRSVSRFVIYEKQTNKAKNIVFFASERFLCKILIVYRLCVKKALKSKIKAVLRKILFFGREGVFSTILNVAKESAMEVLARIQNRKSLSNEPHPEGSERNSTRNNRNQREIRKANGVSRSITEINPC